MYFIKVAYYIQLIEKNTSTYSHTKQKSGCSILVYKVFSPLFSGKT